MKIVTFTTRVFIRKFFTPMLRAALGVPKSHKIVFLARRFGVYAKRIKLWDEQSHLVKPLAHTQSINIQLPDQSTKKGEANLTTPLQVAQQISPGLARDAVVANVNGILEDLTTPFKADSSLSILKFDSFQGQQTFWHSSAHILGQAIELFYGESSGVLLSDGPSLVDHPSGGFFYDFFLPNGKSVDPAQLKQIEQLCQKIIKEKQIYQKLTVDIQTAQLIFEDNPIKLSILKSIPSSAAITVYRCGPFIDLCRGPHMQHTGMAKSFSLLSTAPVVSTLNGQTVQLQRIYGISFPDTKLLEQWKKKQEEANSRDHRLIGKQQGLFMFSALAAGSPFFLPAGTRIYNTLLSFIKSQYRARGYEEVITPLLYSNELWKMSGHWDHYRDDMFFVNHQKEPTHDDHTGCGHVYHEMDGNMGLKPMNCPAHCLIFGSQQHSWRELPVRYADFSPLHRNESSGALRGLTRLRRYPPHPPVPPIHEYRTSPLRAFPCFVNML